MKLGIVRVQKAVFAAAGFQRVKQHRIEIHPVDVATEEEYGIGLDVVFIQIRVRDLKPRPFQSEAKVALPAGEQRLLAKRGQQLYNRGRAQCLKLKIVCEILCLRKAASGFAAVEGVFVQHDTAHDLMNFLFRCV